MVGLSQSSVRLPWVLGKLRSFRGHVWYPSGGLMQRLVLGLALAVGVGVLAGCSPATEVSIPDVPVTVPCLPANKTAVCTEHLAILVSGATDRFDALDAPSSAQREAKQQVDGAWSVWKTECQSGGTNFGELSDDCQAGTLRIAVGASKLDPADPLVTLPSP